jgi:hypothetical protein
MVRYRKLYYSPLGSNTLFQGNDVCKKVVEYIGIKVKMLMTLKVNNKGAKDFINSWSVEARTCHINVCYLFLREAKGENLVKIK